MSFFIKFTYTLIFENSRWKINLVHTFSHSLSKIYEHIITDTSVNESFDTILNKTWKALCLLCFFSPSEYKEFKCFFYILQAKKFFGRAQGFQNCSGYTFFRNFLRIQTWIQCVLYLYKHVTKIKLRIWAHKWMAGQKGNLSINVFFFQAFSFPLFLVYSYNSQKYGSAFFLSLQRFF